MTKTMYLLPKEHSNALRMYGSTVMETTVNTGRKYFTDSTGRRYPVAEPELDVNGNTYYSEYDPQYSGDFLLFETKDAAQLHLECRELLSKIISMRSELDKLPHAKLAAIVNLLESGSDGVSQEKSGEHATYMAENKQNPCDVCQRRNSGEDTCEGCVFDLYNCERHCTNEKCFCNNGEGSCMLGLDKHCKASSAYVEPLYEKEGEENE